MLEQAGRNVHLKKEGKEGLSPKLLGWVFLNRIWTNLFQFITLGTGCPNESSEPTLCAPFKNGLASLCIAIFVVVISQVVYFVSRSSRVFLQK